MPSKKSAQAATSANVVAFPTSEPEAPAVAGRAMLINLSLSQWSAKKLDKKASREVCEANDAQAGVARVNKDLIRKDALAEIRTIASQAYSLIAEKTSPWVHNGPRILSSVIYLDLATALGDLQTRFNIAADAFCNLYPELWGSARASLGDLFNEADYPSPGSIRRRFDFRVDFMPIPTTRDFRVDMGDAQAAAIKAQIETALRESATVAARDIAERIEARVSHMASKLRAYSNVKGEKNLFRDSLVENIRDLAAFIPVLNVYDDARITVIAKRIDDELCDYSAEDLRVDDMARKSVADKADAILADISDYLA